LCSKCGLAHEEVKNNSSQVFCRGVASERNTIVPCKTELYQQKKSKYVPKFIFHFFPLSSLLKRLILYPNFVSNCLYGIQRIALSTGSELMDIFDGNICQKNFKQECIDFLQGRLDYFPLYLIFNSDGFAPYDRSNRSSWVFNFSIGNLHRSLRFKEEFITLVWSVVRQY
jgi:hypothetical protein